MWKGEARSDPVYTECGLEECIPCEDVESHLPDIDGIYKYTLQMVVNKND